MAWLHFYTEPDGVSKLCCIANVEAGDGQGGAYGMQSHSFPDIWNFPVYRDARRKMLAGEPLAGCQPCYDKENHGERSYRHWANQYWGEQPETKDFVADLLAGRRADLDAPPPVSFDVRIGTLCNLKCRMCNSRYSSEIEKDPIHQGWTSLWMPRQVPSRFNGPSDWSEEPQLLADLIAFSKNSYFLQVAGGEPTINKTQIAWLEALAASDRASEISVSIFTNLTNVRPKFFDLLKNFKHVSINLSLDGKENVLEYIRFPVKWISWLHNMDMLRSYKYELIVAVTAQIYNAFHLPQFFDWADDLGIIFDINTVSGSDFLKIGVLPTNALKNFELQMRAYLARRAEKHGVDPHVVNKIEQLIGFCWQEHESVDRRRLLEEFVEFTNDLDRQRGQSFATLCPEALEFIVEDLGEWPSFGRYTGTPRPSSVVAAPPAAIAKEPFWKNLGRKLRLAH